MEQNKLTQVEKDALVILCISSALNYIFPNDKEKMIKLDGVGKEEKQKVMEFMESLKCVKDDDSIYESLNLLAYECHERLKKKIDKK